MILRNHIFDNQGRLHLVAFGHEIGPVGGQQTFSRRAVALPFRLFFIRIIHFDQTVAEVLLVHGLNRAVTGLEIIVGHDGVASRHAGLGVAHNLHQRRTFVDRIAPKTLKVS